MEGYVVGGVIDQSQVREEISDFLAVIKPEATDQLVVQLAFEEGLFEQSRLSIGPIQNRKVFWMRFFLKDVYGDLIGDVVGFIAR
jgi:hypothetical protein